jgi:N-methylhydantoinase B
MESIAAGGVGARDGDERRRAGAGEHGWRRHRHGACGLAGGNDGFPHHYRLRSGGRYRVLETKEVGIPVLPGDVFLIESGGGGGWGNPRRRTREARAVDLENGFVTPPRRRSR